MQWYTIAGPEFAGGHLGCSLRGCRHRVAEPRQAVAPELVQVQARVQVQALDDERLAVPHALRMAEDGRQP